MWNSSCPNEGNKEAEDLEPLGATKMGSTKVRQRALAIAEGMKMPSHMSKYTLGADS